MNYFETFNFDIIIILIIIASIISGTYFGLYRQLRKTLVLAGPFVILYYTFDMIINFINQFGEIKNIFNTAFDFIAKYVGLSSYKNTVYVFIIGLVLYIILALLISLLYSFFKVSKYKRLLKKPNKVTKYIAGILGVVNAYIIILILMFAIKPATDLNYNTPITKIINQTSNEIVIISKLNYYQNINTDNHHNYDEAFSHLTGKRVNNEYLELKTLYDSIVNIDLELSQLAESFTDNSKNLINQHLVNNDYISCLLKEINGKAVFVSIVAFEKNNPKIDEIRIIYNYLMENRGYLYMFENYFNNPFDNYTVFEIYEIMNTNKEAIENEFLDGRYKNIFKNRLVTFAFFNDKYDDYKALVDNSISNLEEYIDAFNELFLDQARLRTFIDGFLTANPKDDSISITIHNAFLEYLKIVDKVESVNKNISLATQIVLLSSYEEWFVEEFNTLNPLLKAYLIDSVTSVGVKGFALYHEYFFYRYLAFDFTLENPLDMNNMITIFTRLDQMVVNGIFSEEEAKSYFQIIFLANNSVIYNLNNQNKIDNTLFSDLSNLDNKYISDLLKLHLAGL